MSEELKKDNFLKVFEMAQANVPIIEENLIINTRTPWVYYGPNNLAPQELIRLYNSSPTHRAAIMSKWFGVRGESISLKNGDDSRLLMANSIGESVYDIWQKATLDFILYGAVSLNIVWRKDRDQGFEIYYTDTSKLRAGRTDMHDRINDYYFSADWAFPKKEPFVPRRLPAFNITSEEPSQIYYYTTHSVGNNYYATPTYWGAATAISTELEIYNWWFNSICNNLQPSLFVSINSGIPDPEQREDIYRTLTQKYGGSNSTSKLMLTFANSKEEAPEITQIATNGSDKMWIEMGASVQQAILTSHQISSAELLGIQTPGALGSRDHLEAQDHFNRLVIAPIQTEIKKVFEKLLNLRDGQPAEIEIKQFKMVSLPDEAPIETVDVNKEEGLDINKNETIN
ncbi:hypothetical protein UFOVP323_10 [uncultured Caudovirales phage]|uniref:Uncharacterized protein n=1 Tax=uncultured Caudovirales phage TaxID=2100421 RepID=A0A6J5LRQ5_9CAUD|nr:hypothetical protein UFOVP323_10 [uncultured Caudovirales phage]